MRMRNISLLYLCLLLFTLSCEKEYENPLDPQTAFTNPGNLTVTETGVNQIKLSWSYTSTIENGFRIKLSGAVAKTIEVEKNQNEYTIDGIIPGEYTIELCAYLKDRESEKTSCTYKMTSDIPVVPDDALYMYALDYYSARMFYEYTKTDSTLKIFEYGLAWSSSKNNPTIEDHFAPQKDNEIKIDGLSMNTKYYIRPYWKCNNGLYYGNVDSIKTYRYSKERAVLFTHSLLANKDVELYLWGDDVYIDWGDGSDIETFATDTVRHHYKLGGERVIAIYGNRIEDLRVRESPFTIGSVDLSRAFSLYTFELQDQNFYSSLDLSKCSHLDIFTLQNCNFDKVDISNNKELTYLTIIFTWVTELDISNNPWLESISLDHSEFNAASLNRLFRQLPSPPLSEKAEINVGGNPGANKCDTTIAINRGWHVDTEDYWIPINE